MIRNSLALLLMTFSWSSLEAQSWSTNVRYVGEARHHPVTFAIGTKAYLGTGVVQNGIRVKDFYEFDALTNKWKKLSDFEGEQRGFAYGVSTDSFGYLGFGLNSTFLNDLWKYDPSTDEWTELASCPCEGRYHPAFVEANGVIYVGLGTGQGVPPRGARNLDDWWAYDIDSNKWERKADFIGLSRHHPYYFSIDSTVYVGLGHGDNAIYDDFYKYNPSDDTWEQLEDFPGGGRVAGTQFSYDGKGFVLSGQNEQHTFMEEGEFWEYTPETDSWLQRLSHPGTSRWAPGSFVIGQTIYLTSGETLNRFGISEYKNDIVQLDLESTATIKEVSTNVESVYPNPTISIVNLELAKKFNSIELTIYNAQMQLEQELTFSNTNSLQLEIEGAKGLYFIKLKNEDSEVSWVKVIKE